MLARERGVLRHSNDRQKHRAMTGGVKMKDGHGVTLCIISRLKSTLELLHSYPVVLALANSSS